MRGYWIIVAATVIVLQAAPSDGPDIRVLLLCWAATIYWYFVILKHSRLHDSNRPGVVEFASNQRIPLVTGWGPWARAGSLMSYGPDLDILVRRAATHVDKILKGAKPADLPVEQPTKFELVINIKSAKALRLEFPPNSGHRH